MLSHPSWSAEPTASQDRIACYGLWMCASRAQSQSLVHSLAGRRPGIRPAYYPSSWVTTSTRPSTSAEDHGSARSRSSCHKLTKYSCLITQSRRFRKGRTRVTVLLDFGTRAKREQIVTGFGAHIYTNLTNKSGQSCRIDRLEGKQASFRLCRSRGNR